MTYSLILRTRTRKKTKISSKFQVELHSISITAFTLKQLTLLHLSQVKFKPIKMTLIHVTEQLEGWNQKPGLTLRYEQGRWQAIFWQPMWNRQLHFTA